MGVRVAVLLGGVALNGVATGAYIGAGLGPGPRDGVMTGLAAAGGSIRVVRTALELSALAGGWVLGGTIGVGTVVYAIAIGPLAHHFIPRLTVRAAVAVRQAMKTYEDGAYAMAALSAPSPHPGGPANTSWTSSRRLANRSNADTRLGRSWRGSAVPMRKT